MDIKLGRRLRAAVEFYSQWENPFSKKLNWLDFDLLHIGVEHDRLAGQFEVYLGLVGLNLRLVFWRVTPVVKPTGFVSVFADSSAGIEPRYAEYQRQMIKTQAEMVKAEEEEE